MAVYFCDVFDSIGELLGINWLCDWLSTKSTGFGVWLFLLYGR